MCIIVKLEQAKFCKKDRTIRMVEPSTSPHYFITSERELLKAVESGNDHAIKSLLKRTNMSSKLLNYDTDSEPLLKEQQSGTAERTSLNGNEPAQSPEKKSKSCFRCFFTFLIMLYIALVPTAVHGRAVPQKPPVHIVDCNVCKELVWLGAFNIDHKKINEPGYKPDVNVMKHTIEGACEIDGTMWTKDYEWIYRSETDDWELKLAFVDEAPTVSRESWHAELLVEGCSRVIKGISQNIANYLTGYVGNGEEATQYVIEMHKIICSDLCSKRFGSFGKAPKEKVEEAIEEEVFGTDNLVWAGLNWENDDFQFDDEEEDWEGE